MARLVTHDDIDGTVSAALMYAMHPGKYDSIAIADYRDIREKRFKFEPTDTVVDLPQSDLEVEFWADHHVDSMKHGEPKNEYLYDEHAPSCAGLIYRHFKDSHPEITRFEELVAGTDIVDSAGYPSAKDAKDITQPAILLNMSLYPGEWKFRKFRYKPKLVRRLAEVEDWRRDIINNEFIQERAREALAGMKIYEEAIDPMLALEGKVALLNTLDVRKRSPGILSRYYIYEKYPDALFSLSAYPVRGGFSVVVTKNAFLKDHPSTLSLGEIAKSINEDSGGHDGIGVISGLSREKADKTVEELLVLLNK